MTAFTVSTTSSATVDADRAAIWAALTDPDLLPRLTPYLQSIDASGAGGVDRWTWHLTRIPLMGNVVSPTFTEVMSFDRPTSIGFTHDPQRTDEKTGVEGSYHLKDAGDGTDLTIELAITVDLPFPRVARPAVHAAMRGVVAAMGKRFSSNLVRHLRRTA
jgi:carbon monoxide dehydrogenase subunit G